MGDDNKPTPEQLAEAILTLLDTDPGHDSLVKTWLVHLDASEDPHQPWHITVNHVKHTLEPWVVGMCVEKRGE